MTALMIHDFQLTFAERPKWKFDQWDRKEGDGVKSKGSRWRIAGVKKSRRVAEEEPRRFGGEGFPDEAQLTVRTYSTLLTGLTTSTP